MRINDPRWLFIMFVMVNDQQMLCFMTNPYRFHDSVWFCKSFFNIAANIVPTKYFSSNGDGKTMRKLTAKLDTLVSPLNYGCKMSVCAGTAHQLSQASFVVFFVQDDMVISQHVSTFCQQISAFISILSTNISISPHPKVSFEGIDFTPVLSLQNGRDSRGRWKCLEPSGFPRQVEAARTSVTVRRQWFHHSQDHWYNQ